MCYDISVLSLASSFLGSNQLIPSNGLVNIIGR